MTAEQPTSKKVEAWPYFAKLEMLQMAMQQKAAVIHGTTPDTLPTTPDEIMEGIDVVGWCEEYVAFVREVESGRIKNAKQWATTLIEAANELRTYHERRIEHWAEENRSVIDTKYGRSAKFPNGRVGWRRSNRMNRDDDKLLTWAKEHAPQYIRTVESVDTVALKKAMLDGTAKVPGEVAEIEEVDSFYVAPD